MSNRKRSVRTVSASMLTAALFEEMNKLNVIDFEIGGKTLRDKQRVEVVRFINETFSAYTCTINEPNKRSLTIDITDATSECRITITVLPFSTINVVYALNGRSAEATISRRKKFDVVLKTLHTEVLQQHDETA